MRRGPRFGVHSFPPPGSHHHGFPPPGGPGFPPPGGPGFLPPGGSGFPPSGGPGFPPSGGPGFPPSGGPGFLPPGGSGFPPSGEQGFPPPGGSGFSSPGGPGFPSQRPEMSPEGINYMQRGSGIFEEPDISSVPSMSPVLSPTSPVLPMSPLQKFGNSETQGVSNTLEGEHKIISVIPNNCDTISRQLNDVPNEEGWYSLHIAVMNNKIETIKELLNQGVDINIRNTINGFTPLHVACVYGMEEIVELLIEKGADKDITTKNGNSAIEIACNNGFDKTVKCLIGYNANINLNNKEKGYRLLFIAVENKDLSLVKLILKKTKIDVNTKDLNKWTALHIAARDNYYEIAQYLIRDKNADINEVDTNLNTPLHIASQYGNQDIVQLLLLNGAKVDIRNHEGWTPIHIACQYNNEEVIHLLIDNKADINITTYENWNSLHIAVYYNNVDAMNYILEKNPDIMKKNKQNLTPIDMAEKIGNPVIIDLLNKYIVNNENDFDIKISPKECNNISSNKSVTDNECECEDEYKSIFNKAENLINEIKKSNFTGAVSMIKCGEIGLEYVDNNGWNALHWSCYFGSADVVKNLIEHNVKIDTKTIYGFNKSNEYKGLTPKSIAEKRGYKDIVKLLNKKYLIEGSKKTYQIFKEGLEIISMFIP